MLSLNRIDTSEGIDVNKISASMECIVYWNWYFLDKGFQFQPDVCNGCHNVLIISYCKEIRTHKQLLCKLTLNHLAKLTKWLSCTVSTYLCNAFKCVFLSSHIRFLAWIYTLYLPECQGTFSRGQARYLKFKRLH